MKMKDVAHFRLYQKQREVDGLSNIRGGSLFDAPVPGENDIFAPRNKNDSDPDMDLNKY